MPLILITSIFYFSIKISKNKYDKESEEKYNPASIREGGTERLQPLVAGGTQRIFRHPYGFFFQKESLPFQTHFKGVRTLPLNICV